eukprot:m.286787 g.286787  ORF g.286787 m.286787 type:complete len:234 (+) comp40699_c0_seq13:342-1043(+)
MLLLETRRVMVYRCVAVGCKNNSAQGVTLHQFPKDPKLRAKWTTQVNRTRAKWSGPTKHSRLCSAHFAAECFETHAELSKQFGISRKTIPLLPDAVPSIFKRPGTPSSEKVAKRSALGKLEHARLIADLITPRHESDSEPENLENGDDDVIEQPFVNKSVQIGPEMKDRGVLTQRQFLTDFAVQCNIISAPELAGLMDEDGDDLGSVCSGVSGTTDTDYKDDGGYSQSSDMCM